MRDFSFLYFIPWTLLIMGIFYNSKFFHPNWLKELFKTIWDLEYPTRSEFLKLSLCYFIMITILNLAIW